MKLIIIAALAGLCVFFAAGAQQAVQPQPITQAENAFAVDLYGQLRHEKGNLFFSPYSVATAISMVYAGAKGETKTQIAHVLHLDMLGNTPDLLGAVGQRKLPRPNLSFQLITANAIWGTRHYPFNPVFIADIKNSFGGELKPVDFKNVQAASGEINAWVSDRTRNEIKNLVSPDMFSRKTRMILTDAVYFKGNWFVPFQVANTAPAIFYVSSNHQVQADRMNMTNEELYCAQDGVQVLSLPYGHGDASMVIILPDRKDGLVAVEAELTAEKLDDWIQNSQYTRVSLSVPKFKTSDTFQMQDALKALGMGNAFEQFDANFTGIANVPDDPLYVAAVVHQAFIDVDETGTEASAATAVALPGVAGSEAFPPLPVPFIADHPFIYLIRADNTGDILFMGRVTDPTQ